MSPIERRLGEGAAFVPYLMAGDPDLATTEAMLLELSAAGAACIEVGIPYSDPLADGPTIAAAGARALAAGVTPADVLALIARARERGCAPIVAFSYYNPIDRYGLTRFADAARAAGAVGVIVPDVPFEEAAPLRAALHARALLYPVLIAPTTPLERARRLCASATGFVYVVARLGVTGADRGFEGAVLAERMAALRSVTDMPLALGFGIARPEQVRVAARLADAVIVGSALIDAYAGYRGDAAVARVAACARELAAACRPPSTAHA